MNFQAMFMVQGCLISGILGLVMGFDSTSMADRALFLIGGGLLVLLGVLGLIALERRKD